MEEKNYNNMKYEYGVMSSKYSIEADNKLTAYAAMIIQFNSVPQLIAIYSPKMNKCMPCGACRQVIAEFAESDTVVLQKIGEEIRPYTINELLPETFVL